MAASELCSGLMAIAPEIKALGERWRSPEGRALAREVGRWLAGKGRRPPRGIGRHDGLVDLRGLVFPDARQLGVFRTRRSTFESTLGAPHFTRVRWRGIDFRGAVIREARFFGSVIQECRFDEADLFEWRLRDCLIMDCTFAGAELQNCFLGNGASEEDGVNVWTRIDFDRADLIGSHVSGAVFRECTFRRAKLRDLWFHHVTFDGVVFEGVLQDLRFEGRPFEGTRDPGPMRNVDFRGVTFRGCDFRGYRFENVAFDESSDITVVHDFPAVIRRALELANASGDPEERARIPLLEGITRERDQNGYDYVFVPADFASGGISAAGEAFGRLLAQAQADPVHPR
jgi:uncharacterized protein YjbI with pentapeptide repeats